MSNDVVKGILLFLAGGAAGTIGTAVFYKRKCEEIIEARVQDELYGIKEEREQGFKEGKELKNGAVEKSASEASEVSEEKLAEISNKVVEDVKRARVKPDLVNAAKEIMEENHYTSYSKRDEGPERNELPEDYEPEPLSSEEDDIEIIAPDEFGEISDYDRVELYYLRDKNLVDDQGFVVEDPDDLIGGMDILDEIGIYEPDTLYVRNNRKQIDFSIVLKNDKTLKNFSL